MISEPLLFILLITISIIIGLILFVCIDKTHNESNRSDYDNHTFEREEKIAGNLGEAIAHNIIKKVLRDDDYLFTNVPVSYDGKNTELDILIVNKYGVFIIEVKNYKGILFGAEDDYEWEKYKNDGYGNIFEKRVKNPIKQVKRQVYILANHFQYYGMNVWVEGYTFLVNGNSPVNSKYLLKGLDDINEAIHTPGRNSLSIKTIEAIKNNITDMRKFRAL